MREESRLAFQEFKSPLIVHLELTSICNHKCIHCYNYWREPGDPHITMSRDHLHHIIENLIESDVHDIVITGGEPLLFPKLTLETIDLAKNADLHCSLNTNLALMTDELATEIQKRDIPILTSFHSSKQATFNEIANNMGAFTSVVEGIKIAVSHGIPVTANIVAMQKNIDHILETGRLLHSLGVSSITATEVHPAQSATNFGYLHLNPEEVISVFNSLQVLQKELGLKIGTLTCHPMCLFKDFEQYNIFRRHCTAGITCGAIGPDGDVRPCPHSDEIYGNAITESLMEIWPRLKEWRDGSYIPLECKECDMVRQCGTGCRMEAKFYNGGYDQQDPYMTNKMKFSYKLQNPGFTADIRDNQEYFVNQHLRFRQETFGTFVNPGDGSKLVSTDSAELLQMLSGRGFYIQDVVKEYNLNYEDVRDFFSELLREKVIIEKIE